MMNFTIRKKIISLALIPLVSMVLLVLMLVRQIGQVVARQLRAAAYVRLDCLDADWPPMAAFCAGLRAGGLVLLRFDHFGNWHDQVSIDGYSGDWAFYLVSRDGALRQTIRRRRAKIARDGGFRWEMVRAGARLEAGIAVGKRPSPIRPSMPR